MIKRVLRYCAQLISNRNKSQSDRGDFDPVSLREDDVLVTSYPKSGNTWVRFLLANALYPNHPVDFHSIHELIPEVGEEGRRRSGLGSPRLLKSHAPYQPDYPRVIYVLRDGRDVYTSYFHYRRGDLPDETTFEEYLARDDHWPSRWSEHVTEWTDAARSNDSILTVRYEDLIEDSAAALRRMLNFLGQTSIDDERISQAAESSRFDNMRSLEKEKGREKEDDTDRFIRKGKVGNWRNLFTDRARKIFKKREGDVLQRLGYARRDNW